MSKIEVDAIEPQSGTTLTIGASGDTITIPSGATLDVTNATVTGLPASGKVLQVVNIQDGSVATGSTSIPFDDTIPQNNEGNEYMTLSITPTSASSKLKIDVIANGDSSDQGRTTVALFQDSIANALAVGYGSSIAGIGAGATIGFSHYMTSGTTSSTTFKVRVGVSAGTFSFNGQSSARKYGGTFASSITITEIEV